MLSTYDIIIIGGGPIGLACALEAKAAGLNYVVLEKGCLVNSLYHYPVNMTFFSTSERLEIGGIPFVSTNAKPTRNEALEYYRRVAVASGLNIHLFEEVRSVQNADWVPLQKKQDALSNPKGFVGTQSPATDAAFVSSQRQKPSREKKENRFLVSTSTGASYTASNIIIATGFYDIPYLLNVPGEDLPKVTHYYNDPHFYAFQKVIVVGANNSAVDAALETWRKGAEVTMIVRKEDIGTRVKYWVRPDIQNRIKEGSIKAYFNATIKEIREKEVLIQTPDREVLVTNDRVIAATGYQPNLEFLSKLGVELSDDGVQKPVYHPDTHETNVQGIFLAGVICGGMNTHSLFIENSREHAAKIIAYVSSR